ncbi:MAG: STT3 domain-containing protein [Pseudomonadota bacterium]
MALVVWVRTLPMTLAGVDDVARMLVRQSVSFENLAELGDNDDQLGSIVKDWLASNPHGTLDTIHLRNDLAFERWIEENPRDFEVRQALAEIELRDSMTFFGEDGRNHPYLDGADSYYWLRASRNTLEKGTACDRTTDGDCRDALALAPVGTTMVYGDSLHIPALAALHTLITTVRPGYPLSSSAMIASVVIGLLGVVPAFFLGRRLSGTLGGFAASLVIGFSPAILERTLSADNDIWNIVLPLYMMWLIVEAIQARKGLFQIGFAALAGAMVGLHALIWSGWSIFFTLSVASLLLLVLIESMRSWRQTGLLGVWRDPAPALVIRVGLAFLVTSLAITIPSGHGDAIFRAAASAWHLISSSPRTGTVDQALPWPNIFSTVNELQSFGALGIQTLIGKPLFALGLVGVAFALFPQASQKLRYGLLLALLGVAMLLLFQTVSAKLFFGIQVGLLVVALAIQILARPGPPPARLACTVILAVWFIGLMVMAGRSERFVMFFAIPFGLAFGVALDRTAHYIPQALETLRLPLPQALRPLTGLVVLGLLIPPITAGIAQAKKPPAMNDAWWESLSYLRDNSPPDAIVTLADWTYGHWAKYVAERPVTADGATLRHNRLHHWVLRALSAQDWAETTGLLRMLNCGSDAAPLPEARHSAFDKLLALGLEPADAYGILLDVVQLEAPAARAHLAELGLDDDAQDTLLASTHCAAPESYLVTNSSNLAPAKRTVVTNLWDFDRVRARDLARRGFDHDALEILTTTHGLDRQRAETMLADQPELGDLELLPKDMLASRSWHQCQLDEGLWQCPLFLTGASLGGLYQSFTYPPNNPAAGRIPFKAWDSDGPEDLTPGLLLIARIDDLEVIQPAEPSLPKVGVLIDDVRKLVFMGPIPLIRSTLVQLLLLNGRYQDHFELVHQKFSKTGELIQVWRINFPDVAPNGDS